MVHIFGLPFHLWNNDNFTRIGDAFGEAVAIGHTAMEFSKLDASRAKLKMPVRESASTPWR